MWPGFDTNLFFRERKGTASQKKGRLHIAKVPVDAFINFNFISVNMVTNYSSKEKAERYAEGIKEEVGVKPILIDVLGDIKDKGVLDLGCGYGKYSKILAEKGAKVLGIDISGYMIELAKKNNSHPNITYSVQDASNMSDVQEQFDIIFMNIVVPNMNKETLSKTLSEASRLLKDNGRFIITSLHPLSLVPDRNPYDKPLDFKKENYFKDGHMYNAEAVTQKGNLMHFTDVHYTISFLTKIFKENGFVIQEIFESKGMPEKGIYMPKLIGFECVKN